MVNILEHNHIQDSILLNLVSQNLDYDHAIYHESDNNMYLRHNLSIGGEFYNNYTGYAGIGIYCCWYENDGYSNIALSSPKLTSMFIMTDLEMEEIATLQI